MTQQPKPAAATAMQIQPPVQLKQVTYPSVQIAVQPTPDGNVMLIMEAPGEVLVFPMPADVAEAIGKKLSAPRIAIAPVSPVGPARG